MDTTAISKVVINWLHLSASMVWMGAIFSSPLIMMRALHTERESVRARVRANIQSTLSPVAWYAMAVLVATGFIKTAGHLDNGWTDLLATEWGRLVIAKLFVIGIMIAAGAYGTYHVVPRLRAARERAGAVALMKRLHATSLATAALGLLLLWIITLL